MEHNRRTFVKKAVYGMLALAGLGSLAAGFRMLAPTGTVDKSPSWFPLISEDAVPRSGVRKAELVYTLAGKDHRSRVFVVASASGLTVLSAVCSHLGCLVNYHKEKKEFLCPCHGGRYDINGRNIAGPPPAPLTSYPVRVQDGMVMVGVKV